MPVITLPRSAIVLRVAASLCLSLATSAAVASEIVYAYHIAGVAPRCGPRGTTVEVTMTGNCLEEPQEVIFYRPGIRASKPVFETVTIPGDGRDRSPATHDSRLTCRFEIAADCPLGEHPFRVRTARELSTVSTFHVTPFPVVDENEQTANANDTIDTAASVAANVTVRGRLGGGESGDVDLYKVPTVAGQRLAVEVDAVRIADIRYGDTEYDLGVRILDDAGRELAASDDSPLHVQDPVAAVRLPRDGFAFVEVRRSVFIPREVAYCIHIGTNSRPLAAYPPGGQAGSALAVKLLGDPLGDRDETIAVPAETGMFEHFGDAPSPLLLRSSPFPNLLEDTAAAETRIESLPVAINGIIEKSGDVDTYRVSAKKGDRLRLRVFAATLGSPLDAAIRIRPVTPGDTPAPVELQADDATLVDRDIFGITAHGGSTLKDTLDPSVIWEPKTDGDYLLEFTDASDSGSPLSVYRVEIEPPADAVNLVLTSTAFYWHECVRTSGLAVPQGGRWTVNVSLPPGQGSRFNGDLELVAHGLPDGVRLVSPPVPAGQTLWPVQFVADATAASGSAVITLEARPVDRTKTIVSRCQQNLPFCNHSGGDAWRTVRLDRFMMAVTDPAPFLIGITPPTAPLVRGGELSIPVKIVRREGFDEPVEFQLGWVPAGLSPEPQGVFEPGQTEAVLRISAAANAPLGIRPLVITASTTQGYEPGWYLGAGRVRVSSDIASIVVAEPFVSLASQPESVRRGERKRFTWSVQQKSPFDGTATVKLVGLPKGVNVVEPLPVITKDSTELAFEIEASDEALMGAVKGLACDVIVQAAGQEIRQRSGSGTLRIDPKL